MREVVTYIVYGVETNAAMETVGEVTRYDEITGKPYTKPEYKIHRTFLKTGIVVPDHVDLAYFSSDVDILGVEVHRIEEGDRFLWNDDSISRYRDSFNSTIDSLDITDYQKNMIKEGAGVHAICIEE